MEIKMIKVFILAAIRTPELQEVLIRNATDPVSWENATYIKINYTHSSCRSFEILTFDEVYPITGSCDRMIV